MFLVSLTKLLHSCLKCKIILHMLCNLLLQVYFLSVVIACIRDCQPISLGNDSFLAFSISMSTMTTTHGFWTGYHVSFIDMGNFAINGNPVYIWLIGSKFECTNLLYNLKWRNSGNYVANTFNVPFIPKCGKKVLSMINLTFVSQNTPKGEVHIFNVIRTTVQSFRHASSKVSEFQITQTRYPIYPNVATKLLS